MNYLKLYESLCAKGKLERDLKYKESHHILPKCLGGSDSFDNLTVLSAKEHYLAHRLLTKIYSDNPKILHAYSMLSVDSLRTKRKYTSKQYQNMKEARSLAMKIDNPMFKPNVAKRMGKTRKKLFKEGKLPKPINKPETLKRHSERMKINNPNKGGAWNHTSFPVEVFFEDGSNRKFEYLKQAAEELNLPYTSLKGARRQGKPMKKYGIVKVIKSEIEKENQCTN